MGCENCAREGGGSWISDHIICDFKLSAGSQDPEQVCLYENPPAMSASRVRSNGVTKISAQ